MKPYNGHKSWDYWNVSLWIGNDEGLARLARQLLREMPRRQAARQFCEMVPRGGSASETPDGAKYNIQRVYEAMEGL